MRRKLAPIYICFMKNILMYKYTMFDIMCMMCVNKTKYCHMMFLKKSYNNNVKNAFYTTYKKLTFNVKNVLKNYK